MGVAVPEAYGGSGGDTVGYALAVEELARACASHAVIMSVNNSLYCDPVCKFGTEEQKAPLPDPLRVRAEVGCFALTEPEAGSDASNQSTLARARRRRLRARRAEDLRDQWARGGGRPRLRPDRLARPGIAASAPSWSRRARRASRWSRPRTSSASAPRTPPSCSSRAAGCPPRSASGEEGRASRSRMATLDGGRIGIAAQAVGIAAGAYETRGGLRAGAQELRRADRPAPDGPVDARRHGDARSRRRGCSPARGRGSRTRAAPTSREARHGQALRVRDGACG